MRRKSGVDLGRFSDPGVLILASLAGGDRHGYGLMQDIAEFSGTRLEPGTLYGALARLERQGWIEPLPAEGSRRPYRLTAAGSTALREQLATMGQIVATGTTRLSPSGD